jgi:hypothetical protein
MNYFGFQALRHNIMESAVNSVMRGNASILAESELFRIPNIALKTFLNIRRRQQIQRDRTAEKSTQYLVTRKLSVTEKKSACVADSRSWLR